MRCKVQYIAEPLIKETLAEIEIGLVNDSICLEIFLLGNLPGSGAH